MVACEQIVGGKDKRRLQLLVWVVFSCRKFAFNELAGYIESRLPGESVPRDFDRVQHPGIASSAGAAQNRRHTAHDVSTLNPLDNFSLVRSRNVEEVHALARVRARPECYGCSLLQLLAQLPARRGGWM
jgi:hypothetical protein